MICGFYPRGLVVGVTFFPASKNLNGHGLINGSTFLMAFIPYKLGFS